LRREEIQMSFLRVTTVGATAIPDLGITLGAATTTILSNQFSINDLYKSADLEALIIASTLTVELDYGTGFSAVLAADYTNRDALASFLNVYEITNENNNEDLVDGSEVNTSGPSGAALHIHDARYFTESEITSTTNGSSGGTLIGVNDDAWDTEWPFTFTTLQGFIDGLYTILSTTIDLDRTYDQDADGVMNIDDPGANVKPLDLRSNGTNDVINASRKIGADYQKASWLDVSADELILGALAVGGLSAIDVRIKRNIIIEGNMTITGTVTDTTVNELNVTNAAIRMRDGATAIPGADAEITVERGTSGSDARLRWNETTDRWRAGLQSGDFTIALLELNELVTGVWEFQGAAATDPSFYLTDKASAPTTQLGAAGQIPLASINNEIAVYDRTRTKWLGINREYMNFAGRDNANNSDEYLRAGSDFTSNQSGPRLFRNMTLIGISAQTNGAETWTVRVRRNGVVTNLASLALSAVAGAQSITTNVDFNQGDKVDVFAEGTSINRPYVRLEFAPRY
jgi:hypothetical protein